MVRSDIHGWALSEKAIQSPNHEHRPAEAELKQKPSHFEIDTILGKDQKSFLLTLVDKALKTVIIRKLPNKRAKTMVAAFRNIEANTFCEFIARLYHS